MDGRRTWRPGERLISPEEWEERQEQERQERLNRFSQGAAAIERGSGGVPEPQHPGYQRPAQHPDLAGLEERFAALNERYSE